MDDSESLQINREEEVEENGEEFYEKIEAPKFVDLTAPDLYHPGEDRYWFCTRVGCDQNHEEEMDSETIYKNFLLRVMAARSPNVRLRKALYRKDSGTDLKCPRTVPAKPSKPRVSRLALISSISKKIVDPKLKVRPLSKQNATPNAKAKQPSVTAKALTTPQTKKQLSNPDAFRSVRNPKTTAGAVPKNKVVAKTLVFHSPKKSARIKISLELNTPVKTLCAGMEKLEITSVKKQVLGCNRPLPSDASRKQLRGREVKSRVFDGLLSQNHKVQEAKSSKKLKKNSKERTLKPAPCERAENNCSEMEIEGKTMDDDSQGVCFTTSKTDEGNVHEETVTTTEVSESSLDVNKVEALSDTSRSNLSSGDDENVPKFEAPVEIMDKDHKRHTSTSDDKENDNEVTESDDKENVSASDDNRELDLKSSKMDQKILRKHETPKDSQKITKAKIKQSKETSAATGGQGLKHKKPKPTHPKPFRLRTDERGILKEANQEKKIYPAPLSEITPIQKGGNSHKKHQNTFQRNDKCLDESENHNDTYERSENETNNRAHKTHQPQNGNLNFETAKERVGRKIWTTPQRHTISSQQKLVTSHQECGKDKSTPKLGKTLKRTKSPSMRQPEKPQEVTPSRKEMMSIMTTGQLGTIKETSPTILKATEAVQPGEIGASPATRNITSVSPASRPSLQGKRLTTIPKEPNFHSIHTPKSCTRRMA